MADRSCPRLFPADSGVTGLRIGDARAENCVTRSLQPERDAYFAPSTIARNLQTPIALKGGRILPDGHKLIAAGVGSTAELWSKGLPIWNFFPDMTTHPSGQPIVASPGLRRPMGVAWIELGGTAAERSRWIGQPGESLKIRFNGKSPGLYAVAVATETTEIVIRRKAINES